MNFVKGDNVKCLETGVEALVTSITSTGKLRLKGERKHFDPTTFVRIINDDSPIRQQGLEMVENLLKVVHYMDIDSPRFIDYITFQRMVDKSPVTHSGRHLISNNNIGAELPELINHMPSRAEILRMVNESRVEPLPAEEVIFHIHKSDNIYRIFVVHGRSMALMVSVGADKGSVAAAAIGDSVAVDTILEIYRTNYSRKLTVNYDQLCGFGQQGPVIKTSILTREEAAKWGGKDEFYPFVEGGLEQLAKDFDAHRGCLLFLIGPPGTGKTALARSLITHLSREKNVVANDENVITDAGFMPFLHTLENDITITVEDADNLLTSRKTGNKQMSSLLNFAEGVVKTSTRMIISTNLPSLDKVDPAAIRHGRRFKVIAFRELTQKEANAARKAIDMPPIKFPKGRKTVTLAEALNFEDGIDDLGNLTQGLGFK